MSKANVQAGIQLITALMAFFPKTRDRVNQVLVGAGALDNAYTVSKSAIDQIEAAAAVGADVHISATDAQQLAAIIRQGRYLIALAKSK